MERRVLCSGVACTRVVRAVRVHMVMHVCLYVCIRSPTSTHDTSLVFV